MPQACRAVTTLEAGHNVRGLNIEKTSVGLSINFCEKYYSTVTNTVRQFPEKKHNRSLADIMEEYYPRKETLAL